ncbi:MAG: N-acetylmuramoyl-L-alanine amidase [Putridiphycobacter sp.]|nr:N-acetylmuramoyl-L-alanine amidase [Putridiphycobacter sp.]
MLNKLLIFCFVLVSFISIATKSEVTILIDPGHGGKDPGHLSLSKAHLPEKDLNLLISKKIGHYLEHNLSNVTVLYTRTTDVYPSLDDRVKQANSKGVDYMMSIHCNGSDNTDIQGTETHIHNFESKEAYKWALQVEKQFKTRAGRKSRGIKTGADIGHSLQILKFTKMPTILIECGFLTNVSEAAYLNSEYGQEIIASAIFRATRAFLKASHPNIDFSPQAVSGPSFKVQIMSSIDPLETDIPEFKRLEYSVERVKINSSSMYKYKYFIGPFATKKLAKKAQKDVQAKGYKDAFIVNFE